MELAKAKSVLESEKSTWPQKVNAVVSIIESKDSTIRDIYSCLFVGGLCAEFAAIRLHILTGRERPKGESRAYILPEEWQSYLGQCLGPSLSADEYSTDFSGPSDCEADIKGK
jgi:hypothetical protein